MGTIILDNLLVAAALTALAYFVALVALFVVLCARLRQMSSRARRVAYADRVMVAVMNRRNGIDNF